MEKLIKANNLLQRHRWLVFVIGFFIIYSVGLLVLFTANQYQTLQNQRLEQSERESRAAVKAEPVSSWFVYKSVEYRGQDVGGGLLFESDREIYRDIDVTWIDTLKCENNKTGRFVSYSVQVFPGDMSPTDQPVNKWVYAEPYPLDTLCFLESDINGVEKRFGAPKEQELIGEVFRTPKE